MFAPAGSMLKVLPKRLGGRRFARVPRLVAIAAVASLSACISQPPDGARSKNTEFTSVIRSGDEAVVPASVGVNDTAVQKAVSMPVVPKPENRSVKDGNPTTPSSTMRGCYLKVDGIVHVDGPCLVFPMGKDEYTLNTWANGKPGNSHFAMVSAKPDGNGTATWNADPNDDRALDLLGTVRKDGYCWVNDRTRICVH